MKIAVIADELAKEELLTQGLQGDTEVEWITGPGGAGNASICMDLLFTPDEGRMNELKKLPADLIIINAVSTTLSGLPENFVRLNGWGSFLKRDIAEAVAQNENIKARAEKVFACLGRSTQWVPDLPGFISARVVSMIINEAYYALDEKVSSKEEIDTAMKLGTNYPYGPFEWSRKIGLKAVYDLLLKMAESHPRYSPAGLLQQEAITG